MRRHSMLLDRITLFYKYVHFPKLIYKFKINLIKILGKSFKELDKPTHREECKSVMLSQPWKK